MDSDSRIFIEKTLEALDINKKYNRLGVRGFEYDKSETEENCVLVIGLNPAGDNTAAKNEVENRTYLYSLRENIKSPYVYNKYYRPIYDLMNEVFDDNVKWHWCNKDWSTLENEIKNFKEDINLETIKKEYLDHADKTVTIYVGDMFYFHETNSKELPIKDGYDVSTYCKEMLELHVNALKKAKKSIKMIYINNSQVSQWLCDNSLKTVDSFRGIPVFFGRMLSGGIDLFSQQRLVNEIRNRLNFKDTMYYTFERYVKELKRIKLQNNIECELYSIIASIIREANKNNNIYLRDVTVKRKSKKGVGDRYYGASGFPDFVVVSDEESKEPDILGAVEVKHLGDLRKNTTEENQLKGHINTFKKVLYTNGLTWEFHSNCSPKRNTVKTISISLDDSEKYNVKAFEKIVDELSSFWKSDDNSIGDKE
jgi:hypothetical protein